MAIFNCYVSSPEGSLGVFAVDIESDRNSLPRFRVQLSMDIAGCHMMPLHVVFSCHVPLKQSKG